METVIHYFNEVMTVLNWIARNVPWDAVFASGLLSGLLIGPQKLVKKWFKRNEQVIITIIALVGPTAVAAWTYLLHHYGTDPHVVVLQGLAVSFMTQPFYFMFWKPYVMNKFWPMVVAWAAKQVAEAQTINEARLVPASGAGGPAPSVTTVPTPPNEQKISVPIQDFKP